MTEAEWLACDDPNHLISFVIREGDDRLDVIDGAADSEPEVVVVPGWATERKFRLLASACCRLNDHMMALPAYLAFLSAFDRFVEGAASPPEACDAGDRAIDALGLAKNLVDPSYLALTAARAITRGSPAKTMALGCSAYGCAATDEGEWMVAVQVEKRAKCLLLRDLFGYAFRPVSVHPAWLTPVVASLAQAAYDERALPVGELDPARLAVLSDALEEAGCTDADLLSHLRSPGPHVRGCWALDLILGKE